MATKLWLILACLALVLLWVFCIWHHLPEFAGSAQTVPTTTANTNANVQLSAPSLKFAFENGKYRITGTVPDQATKDKILARAREVYGEGNFIDELKIGQVSAPGWLDSALALLPFTKNGVTNGGLSIEGSSIALVGNVPNEEAKAKIYKDAVAAVPADTTVVNLLNVEGQKALTAEQAKVQVKLNEQLTGKIVEFETGSDQLTDKGKSVLDELVPIFQSSADNIEIGGHTDNQGNAAKNMNLSLRRAETVKKYLTAKNLDQKRFSTKGYGQEKPVADNTTLEGRQRNRRIDFQIKGGEK